MWCWWCCHPFDGKPLQMPVKYDEKLKRFHTAGNYCSWSCIKSHAIDKYGCTKGGMICGNIVVMRKQLFNQIGSIKPAPNRYKLNVFGGSMTIDEFRSNQTMDSVERAEIKTKPVTNRVIPIVESSKKLDDIKNSQFQNNTLKLKRAKPLKRNHNNLESALGLIITSSKS